MAKTRGISCDRCPKMVEIGKDISWCQVIIRRRQQDGGFGSQKEQMDLCPACAYELAKWNKAYVLKGDEDDVAE